MHLRRIATTVTTNTTAATTCCGFFVAVSKNKHAPIRRLIIQSQLRQRW
jgi:hypothetical protein